MCKSTVGTVGTAVLELADTIYLLYFFLNNMVRHDINIDVARETRASTSL